LRVEGAGLDLPRVIVLELLERTPVIFVDSLRHWVISIYVYIRVYSSYTKVYLVIYDSGHVSLSTKIVKR